MKTEYAVGNLRLRFESRARPRWLVVLFYAGLAFFNFAWIPAQGRDWFREHARWLACALFVVFLVLHRVFSWLTNDMRDRGDEREMHRREHAYAKAYRVLGNFVVVPFLAATLLLGLNPVTPNLPLAARPYLAALPLILLTAASMVYISLPQAILLWTEPDMEGLS